MTAPEALPLFPDAVDAAARSFAADTAIDSIVYRVFPDDRFPGPTDADGFRYAAFYKTAGFPATIYGVYSGPDAAALDVANRRALAPVCKWCLNPAGHPRHDFDTPGNYASAKHDFAPLS